MGGFWAEVGRAITGKGAVVVPLCKACHDTRGGLIRLKNCKGILDPGCAFDFRPLARSSP